MSPDLKFLIETIRELVPDTSPMDNGPGKYRRGALRFVLEPEAARLAYLGTPATAKGSDHTAEWVRCAVNIALLAVAPDSPERTSCIEGERATLTLARAMARASGKGARP